MIRPKSIDRAPSAERIIQIRNALDETQQQFAARLGTTQASVARWELDIHRPQHYRVVKQLIELDQSVKPPDVYIVAGSDVTRHATKKG